jgi:hypothetical protein
MGAAEKIATFRKKAARMASHLLWFELFSAKGAFQERAHRTPVKKSFAIILLQNQIPIHCSRKFTTPPTPKAMGKITTDIQSAFLKPLSLTIIKN